MKKINKLFLTSMVFGPGISYGYMYLYHLILFIVFFKFILGRKNCIIKKKKKLHTNLHIFFVFMFFWYASTFAWSINYVRTAMYLCYILFGICISTFIIYSASDLKKLRTVFNILKVGFLVEIIVSLFECLTSFRWPISPFSNLVTYFGREKTYSSSLDTNTLNYLFSMPTGFQWNPNDLAVTMVILLSFFLLAKRKYIKIPGVFVILFIIIESGSRSSLFAMLLMIIIHCLIRLVNNRNISMFICIVAFLFSLNFFKWDSANESILINKINEIFYLPSAIVNYFDYSKMSGKDSISERKILIKNGIQALHDSHWIGIGAGCSNEIQKDVYINNRKKITSMHNFWIEMLVESGILFFIIFIIWYTKIIINLFQIYCKQKIYALKYYGGSCCLSLICFIAASISSSSVIYFFPMWILLGFSISIININNKLNYENSITL